MTAFRKIVATLLLIGIVVNCFNQWLLFSSYSFNKSYIATVLCTNKDKPELHCEGKCFMDIKLKELEQKNKHAQENLKRLAESVAPCAGFFLEPLIETNFQISIPYYLSQAPIAKVASIFQPPKQS